MSIRREDLIRLLREEPSLVEELRTILLTQDIVELPAREDSHFRQAMTVFQELAEAIKKVEEHIAALTERMERVEAQIQRNSDQIAALAMQVSRLVDKTGSMYGRLLQIQYRQNPYGYFGEIIRRARWVTGDELDAILEAGLQAGRITEDEMSCLIQAELIVQGVRRGALVWLVVEVSGTIEWYDFERVRERTQILERCTTQTVFPVVAGEFCPEEVLSAARQRGVWVIQDGKTFAPYKV